VESRAQRSGQGDRQTRPHRPVHPHHPRSGRYEAQSAFYVGNPRVNSPETEWVTVALLGKTRGNRGELTAFSLSSKPERFENLREVYLFGSGEKYEVEETWFHLRTLIFKFRGVDTISDAEKLVGAEVRVPLSERAPLDPGEFYESDLIGCEV